MNERVRSSPLSKLAAAAVLVVLIVGAAVAVRARRDYPVLRATASELEAWLLGHGAALVSKDEPRAEGIGVSMTWELDLPPSGWTTYSTALRARPPAQFRLMDGDAGAVEFRRTSHGDALTLSIAPIGSGSLRVRARLYARPD